MACVGRAKECTIVPSNHFGPIPGVDVGTTWRFRFQVIELSHLFLSLTNTDSVNSRHPKLVYIAHRWEAFTVARKKEPTVSFSVVGTKTIWTMATHSIIRDQVVEI